MLQLILIHNKILVEMLKGNTCAPLYLISITRQVLTRYKNSKVITNKWITQFHQTNDAWEECGAIIAKTVDDSSASDEPLVIFAQQNILCPKIFV